MTMRNAILAILLLASPAFAQTKITQPGIKYPLVNPTVTGPLRPQLTTVGNLATVNPTPQAGDMISVSDATTCTANSTVTGGGSTPCALVYTGAAWKAIVTH